MKNSSTQRRQLAAFAVAGLIALLMPRIEPVWLDFVVMLAIWTLICVALVAIS